MKADMRKMKKREKKRDFLFLSSAAIAAFCLPNIIPHLAFQSL
jgi:hypothetical protein